MVRWILSGILLLYVVWLVFGYQYHFLDGVNLLLHEAGHVFFGFLGQTMQFLGGTLGQLAFPVMFFVYFWRKRQRFEAYVVGIWLCESLMYTAEYMADARVMQLPLVGGHIHDWNWLLARWGMLRQAEDLGQTLHVIASLGAIALLIMSARELKRAPRREPTESPSATRTDRKRTPTQG
jgi:hypothetical protein